MTCITQAGCCVCALAWLITVAVSNVLVHTFFCSSWEFIFCVWLQQPLAFLYNRNGLFINPALAPSVRVCVLYLMVISRLGSRWDGGQKGSWIITDNSPDLLLRRTPLNKVTWYCNEVQESHVYHMHSESISAFGTGCEGFIWRYMHANSPVQNNGVCVLWKCLFWIQSCWKLD